MATVSSGGASGRDVFLPTKGGDAISTTPPRTVIRA